MAKIDLVNQIEEDIKLVVDDVMHIIKTMRTDVDQLQKEVKKLKPLNKEL